MKNSTRMILIVICFILVIFLIGVLVWGIVARDFEYGGKRKIVKEEHYDITEIDSIIITTRSADIKFYDTDGNDVRIVQKMGRKANKRDLFQTQNHGGILEIEETSGRGSFCIGFCFMKNSDYEIYLPSSYQKKIIVKTASGDVDISLKNELLKQVEITTTSGDIHLKSKLILDRITLKSTSGDIQAVELNSSAIYMGTVSGDIETEALDGNIEIKTTSGDIETHYVKGSVQIKTVSGEVEIDDFVILGESKITTTSGDIDVVLDSASSCKMSADSVSGDIRFPHSESVIGDGTHLLYFKTVSGDIQVTNR